jgi:hypothetical protein
MVGAGQFRSVKRGRLQHYSITKGGGFRLSICVLQGKPEKWLHYYVMSLRQYKQAG